MPWKQPFVVTSLQKGEVVIPETNSVPKNYIYGLSIFSHMHMCARLTPPPPYAALVLCTQPLTFRLLANISGFFCTVQDLLALES